MIRRNHFTLPAAGHDPAAGTWTIHLPFTTPLSLNDGGHWAKRAARTRIWRDTATGLARKHQIPRLARITVELHYAPRDERRRDIDNLIAGLKPLVDGLVVGRVIPDDVPAHYQLTSPMIHPATGEPGRVWIVVRDLDHPAAQP